MKANSYWSCGHANFYTLTIIVITENKLIRHRWDGTIDKFNELVYNLSYETYMKP